MKEIEPCPLNGKDLVGECIVDEIYDRGEFVSYHLDFDKYLGLINGVPVVVDYAFGTNFINFEVLGTAKWEKVLVDSAIETFVKRFNEEEAYRKVGAETILARINKHQTVRFFYYE